MCSVWNAPATCSGRSRARLGRLGRERGELRRACRRRRSGRRRSRWRRTRPCSAERGEDLVGVAAEDRGHAGRRVRRGGGHRPAALADEDHRLLGGDDPARSAAVSSPTECPAPTPTVRRRPAGRSGQGDGPQAASPAATSSGWATAVSRMVVGVRRRCRRRARSRPGRPGATRERSATEPGSSSQGGGSRATGRPGRARR